MPPDRSPFPPLKRLWFLSLIPFKLLKAVGPYRTWTTLIHTLGLMSHPRLPKNHPLVTKRSNSCEICPYWDSRVDVCGFVGETYRDRDEVRQTVGCWCNLRSKRRILAAVCWADAHQIAGSGWGE